MKNCCASAERLLERQPSPARGRRTLSPAAAGPRETVPRASGIYSKKVLQNTEVTFSWCYSLTEMNNWKLLYVIVQTIWNV